MELALIILELIVMADAAVAQALNNNRNTQIARNSNQLAKEIAEDEALANKLLNAYQMKDTDLLQNLINSSPFGSRFSQLKREYKQNKNDIAKVQDEVKRIQSEGQKAINDMNTKSAASQTSGSAVIDSLISGRAYADTSKSEYQRSQLGGLTENA